MAYRNKVIKNPVTGQDIRFILTAKETGGSLLEMESGWMPGAAEPPMHYHPSQTEFFTILSGELTVRMDGMIKVFKTGDQFQIPPNKAHAMWSNTAEYTKVNWKIMPALNTDKLLETGMGLASEGKVNKKGMPHFLQGIMIGKKFSGVFRLAQPSFLFQWLIFMLLSPVAWIRGYRPVYKKYID